MSKLVELTAEELTWGSTARTTAPLACSRVMIAFDGASRGSPVFFLYDRPDCRNRLTGNNVELL